MLALADTSCCKCKQPHAFGNLQRVEGQYNKHNVCCVRETRHLGLVDPELPHFASYR